MKLHRVVLFILFIVASGLLVISWATYWPVLVTWAMFIAAFLATAISLSYFFGKERAWSVAYLAVSVIWSIVGIFTLLP